MGTATHRWSAALPRNQVARNERYQQVPITERFFPKRLWHQCGMNIDEWRPLSCMLPPITSSSQAVSHSRRTDMDFAVTVRGFQEAPLALLSHYISLLGNWKVVRAAVMASLVDWAGDLACYIPMQFSLPVCCVPTQVPGHGATADGTKDWRTWLLRVNRNAFMQVVQQTMMTCQFFIWPGRIFRLLINTAYVAMACHPKHGNEIQRLGAI